MLRHGSCVLVVVCVVVVLLLFVVNVLAIECWDAFANTADTLIVCAGMFPRNFVLLCRAQKLFAECCGNHSSLTHRPFARDLSDH